MVKSVEMTKSATSDWLAVELQGNHQPSRENAVVAASQTLKDGMPISIDVTGKIQAFGGATDEKAAGIFIGADVVTGAGETKKGVYLARIAKVVVEELTWKSGVASPKQMAALADLAALNITTVRSA